MITATVEEKRWSPVKVMGVVNRGGWWGKTWLVEIYAGFYSIFLVVEADTAQDALDELADSKRWGHTILIDPADKEEYETAIENGQVAGNYGLPVIEGIQIYRCVVNYFAKPESV